jgi:hypothetical protein
MTATATSSTSPQRILAEAQGLLRHVGELVKHGEELQRATGEQFNLFQVLGVGHYEVSTHSALLASLLDPRGSHGQGPRFLEGFIDVLKLEGPFDAGTASVKAEVSIGARTDTTGGRLDILLTDRTGNQIAIENKIYAGEQENWVRRYRNGIRDDAHLIYLTLDGSSPCELDEGQEDKVLCVSYATSIVQWLETCRKEVATIPIVRESLTQYIHLIQHLTHQNTSSRMNEGIVNSVILTPESFDAYRALRDADRAVKGAVILKLVERLRPRIPAGFDQVTMPGGRGEKHDGFTFTTPTLRNHNLKAVISFDAAGYGLCFYGFEFLDRSQRVEEHPETVKALTPPFIGTFEECKSSNRWPAWTYWSKNRDWHDDVLRRILFDGTEFDDEVIQVIEGLLEVARQFELAAQEIGNP